MASEYNVSPETIRRSLRLLADMKVVEVKPPNAARWCFLRTMPGVHRNFDEDAGVHALRAELKNYYTV